METKEGLENLTSIMIVMFSLLFIHTHIIDINIMSKYLGFLFYPIIIIIMYLIKINLFSYDFLLFGNEDDKYVKAFKHKLPSKYISEKYKISKEDADHYWFNIFNSWQNSNHPRYSQTLRTFKRGYSCRFVFYSIKVFEFLIIMSVSLFLLLHVYAWISYKKIFLISDSYKMVGFIFLIFCLRFLLNKFNNPKTDNLTGVWEKFANINEDHIKWLNDNIIDLNALTKYK